MTDARIGTFLQKLAEIDDSAPLSDAKLESLQHQDRMLVIEEGDDIVAVGATASHQQPDGRFHWSIETTLDPGLRFPEFEKQVLVSALALPPVGASISVWSHRTSLDTALLDSGFAKVRDLAHFTVALPLAHPGPAFRTRTFVPNDEADVISVNRSAFLSHREAASLDEAELRRLLSEEGLGSSGLLLAEEGNTLVGFCWTRVHSNGDGEIFRIAVAPEAQGRGLGRRLVLAGFEHLSGQPGVSRGTLWAELSNERAVALYQSIGMTIAYVNREFEKPEVGG